MKIFCIWLIVFAFVFNAFALNAYASSCPQPDSIKAEQVQVGSDFMPCHGVQETLERQKLADKHCDGICLCFDAAQHVVTILPHLEMPKLFFETVSVVMPSDHIRHSLSVAPPYRPPITLS